MFWNRIRQTSLKLRLLLVLLPVMALTTATSLWLTRLDSVAAANAAYDRSLLGAIKALDLNVSTASGGLAVELPYRLFEFFQLTATGSVYFRVATADGLVEVGNPGLPLPAEPLTPEMPRFYDAVYFGETVRIGAFMRTLEQRLDSTPSTRLIIQVAESTRSREQFTTGFLRRAALRDTVLLVLVCLAVVSGLWMALRPLSRLAAQTSTRDTHDIRPLSTHDLPSDLRPLVDAVNLQLARSERLLRQRRKFVDDASHQLRTPLTVLRAQMDFILRETNAGQKESALHALSTALDQAIRATNQLLILARSDASAVQAEPLDLSELARRVALELLPAARARGVDLGLDEGLGSPLPSIGDALLLHQALLNLVHNAIEHGRAHGVVTLQASVDSQGYQLEVVDDGPGMARELLGQWGHRFAKSRGSRGSGLGLAIARSAIESHGGHLRTKTPACGVGLQVGLWWPASGPPQSPYPDNMSLHHTPAML
jgi:two-component system, OmpR family, sensor histidine kinase TctE